MTVLNSIMFELSILIDLDSQHENRKKQRLCKNNPCIQIATLAF